LIREIALDAPHFAIEEPLNSKAAQLQCHSNTSYPLDLDFVPFHKLEMEINKIQYSLQLGSTTILEFSCLAPGVRFMGYNFILCAIPLLLRTCKDSKDALKYGRTTAPLQTQFNTFVAFMSSESSTIESIGNISCRHAHSLLVGLRTATVFTVYGHRIYGLRSP